MMRAATTVLGWGFLSTLVLVGPAQATQSISCLDMKSDSSVDILLGAGPVSKVLRVLIGVGERLLTTEPSLPGERVVIAQAFDDGEVFRIDLVDEQATKLVATIRLIYADHDSLPLRIGFVRIGDDPAVGISCEGP